MRHTFGTVVLTIGMTLGSVWGYRALADEHQPHMRAALHHLEEAKKELDMAAADKGGHREKAIDLTQHAMDEVKEGIQFADK